MSRAPTVIALVAAYNEGDVIAQVVGDLIAQGCGVYLIDHASTDDTVARASAFLGRGLQRIERFPDESGFPPGDAQRFAWASILRRKEQLAAELDADWLMHADADELRESPWPRTTLAEGIAAVDALGYDAIDFEVFNFRPVDDRFQPGDELRAAFPYYERGATFDRLQIKAWKKQRVPVDLVSTGGHEARFDGRRVFPVRFVLRHYPVRSQAHGERKVRSERRPRFVDEERQRGWHVQYDAVEEGHRFVRSPAELERWDDLAVRFALCARNRAVEAIEARAFNAARVRDEAQAEAARLQDEAGELRRERDRFADEAALLYAERTRREADLQALREDLAASRRERDRFAGEAAALYAERKGREADLQALRDELTALRRERDHVAGEAAALYREREVREATVARLGERLQALATERDALAAERDRLAVERDHVASERDRIAADRDRIAADRDRIAADRDRIAADRDHIAADRDRIAADRDARVAELGAAEARLVALGRALERRGAEVAELDGALKDAHAQLDALFGSRTWRLTAPARLAWRLLGRE